LDKGLDEAAETVEMPERKAENCLIRKVEYALGTPRASIVVHGK